MSLDGPHRAPNTSTWLKVQIDAPTESNKPMTIDIEDLPQTTHNIRLWHYEFRDVLMSGGIPAHTHYNLELESGGDNARVYQSSNLRRGFPLPLDGNVTRKTYDGANAPSIGGYTGTGSRGQIKLRVTDSAGNSPAPPGELFQKMFLVLRLDVVLPFHSGYEHLPHIKDKINSMF